MGKIVPIFSETADTCVPSSSCLERPALCALGFKGGRMCPRHTHCTPTVHRVSCGHRYGDAARTRGGGSPESSRPLCVDVSCLLGVGHAWEPPSPPSQHNVCKCSPHRGHLALGRPSGAQLPPLCPGRRVVPIKGGCAVIAVSGSECSELRSARGRWAAWTHEGVLHGDSKATWVFMTLRRRRVAMSCGQRPRGAVMSAGAGIRHGVQREVA